MRKLKEFVSTGEFGIIDNFNHQWVEQLPRDKAIAKYGECDVWSSYTAGSSQVPDGEGNVPSWQTDVWVEIPGMKIGPWNDTNLHLRFCGTQDEATFVGKKSGQLITVYRHGDNDFFAWWRDESEKDMENRGFSVRGTAKDIIKELEGEWE